MSNWRREEIVTRWTVRKSMTYSEIFSESLLLATCGNFVTTGNPITSELGRERRKHSLRTARIFARHILTEYDVKGEP